MVKHCYSVANSSRQLLGTHWYQCCYSSGYNSQACSFGQSTVVSVALGQRLKAGGLVLNCSPSAPYSVWLKTHPVLLATSLWHPPRPAHPRAASSTTQSTTPPPPCTAQRKLPELCFLQGAAVYLERKGLPSQVFLSSDQTKVTH